MDYKTDGQVYKQDNMTIINDDCMSILNQTPDNYYDLCIVDPPYGLERFKRAAEETKGVYAERGSFKQGGNWNNEKPTDKYFQELFRVSENQIIWGANNFTLPQSEYFLIWDKMQFMPNFASAEYAWVSMGMKKPAKVFRYDIHKVNAIRTAAGGKIHPAQKPVRLYDWIYANYAEPGQKILDTHGGSFSNAIAAHYAKMEFVGCELDEDYYKAAIERIRKETRQLELF